MSETNGNSSFEITPDVLEQAYRLGIFPMGDPETGEVEWYQPNPRALIDLERFHVPRRLAKTLRSGRFAFTVDQAFGEVIRYCGEVHAADGVWITPEIMEAYRRMHECGKAHSVEVWREGRLVGGLYGVALGAAFMGESMFHLERDASKAALAWLVARLRERGFTLLDTQFSNPHLERFGILEVPHREYMRRLREALGKSGVAFV